MGTTKIEWTKSADRTAGKTWNPIRARLKAPLEIPGRRGDGGQHFKILPAGTWGYHCEPVSPGCKNCYAEAMNGRTLPAWGTGLDYTRQSRDKVDIYLDEEELLKPLRWKKPRMVFVCSMTDLFAEFVPDEFIDRMFAVMALCPQHTFQLLSKRAKRLPEYLSPERHTPIIDAINRLGVVPDAVAAIRWPLPNLWLGVSVEDHPRADERLPHLLATPAAVRWVSYEPALGPVDFRPYLIESGMAGTCWDIEHNRWHNPGMCPHCSPALSWIVAGGESGRGARPCDLAWLRGVRDQCAAAAVPVFVKQIGARPWDSAGAAIDHLFEPCGHPCNCCDECPSNEGQRDPADHPQVIRLKDRKGGDPAEWPADLRVRQMPAAAGARA